MHLFIIMNDYSRLENSNDIELSLFNKELTLEKIGKKSGRKVSQNDIMLCFNIVSLIVNLVIVCAVLTIYFSWNTELKDLYNDANILVKNWNNEYDNTHSIIVEIKKDWDIEYDKIDLLVNTINKDWQLNYRNITRLTNKIEADWDSAYAIIKNLLSVNNLLNKN